MNYSKTLSTNYIRINILLIVSLPIECITHHISYSIFHFIALLLRSKETQSAKNSFVVPNLLKKQKTVAKRRKQKILKKDEKKCTSAYK